MDPALAITEPAWLVATLGWIAEHPLLAMLVLALAMAIEGLFLIGMIIPGSLLMFAAGAIAVAGQLPLVPVLLVCALGAWAGDCASFALGRALRSRLPALAQRWRLSGTLQRAETFFADHGGKSVLLGRFIGPLRPLVPAIAGASGMRATHFVLIDLVAALLWAPAYGLPGVLVGATLSLAAEVATRLALLLALVLAGAFLIWWLIIKSMRLSRRYAEPALGRMMDWSHRHRRLGNLGPALADPEQPESPVLLASLLLLGALGWLLGRLWWVGPGVPGIDEAVYDSLAGLYSPAVEPLLGWLMAPGEPLPGLLLGGGLLLYFVILRRGRAAAHWAAAGVGGLLLGLTLPGAGAAIGPAATLRDGTGIALALTLGFSLAGLLASGQSARLRIALYVGISSLLGLQLLAQLIHGGISFSQAALAVVLALIWSSLLSLGYRRHLRGTRRLRVLPTLATCGLLLMLAVPLAPQTPLRPAAAAGWEPPLASPDRVNLQWHGDAQRIRASLVEQGWQPLPAVAAADYLRWLMPGAGPDASLPNAPRWLAGQRPELSFEWSADSGGPTWLLRLWREPGADSDRWLGQLGQRELRRWAGLMRVPVTRHHPELLSQFAQQMSGDWSFRPATPVSPWLVSGYSSGVDPLR